MGVEWPGEVPDGPHWAVVSFYESQGSSFRFSRHSSYHPIKDSEVAKVRKTLGQDQILVHVSETVRPKDKT